MRDCLLSFAVLVICWGDLVPRLVFVLVLAGVYQNVFGDGSAGFAFLILAAVLSGLIDHGTRPAGTTADGIGR